jgi:hypothetical protein
MSLYHIRLEMARNKDFPDGNPARGYDIVAPLDAESRLDRDAWKKAPTSATVTRFWDGERAALGQLVWHRKGGWVFDFEPGREDDDETGFRFADHAFTPGEYVSVRDHGADELHTFVVKSVTPA